MSPDRKKKRFEDFPSDDDFDEIMRRFFEEGPFADFFKEFDRMVRKLFGPEFELSQPIPREFEERPIGRSYVWGFSITIGPDGRPVIKRFGNIKPMPTGIVKASEEFEPLSTVYEEDNKIKVIVDLPGAKKETIRIDASEREVEVRAEGTERKYYKRIRLPTDVDPDTAKARYENGVLEIVFEKKGKKKPIKVE